MNLEKIRTLHPPSREQRYDERDTILYALGLGYGSDPLDESELPFVYEASLRAVPSICSVLAHPGFWLKDPVYGIDWVNVLHAEQEMMIHRPIPPTGHVRGEYRVFAIDDKGAGKGSMLHLEKSLRDASRGDEIAKVRSSILMRGDGGQGGFGAGPAAAEAVPVREPDRVVQIATLPSAALLYRLSGDDNPLHADPTIARKAGFDRPILHGLCSYGIACRAILAAYCDNEPARLHSMFARFSSPVYPGESLRFEFHETGAELRFKALVKERNTVVLDRGRARLANSA